MRQFLLVMAIATVGMGGLAVAQPVDRGAAVPSARGDSGYGSGSDMSSRFEQLQDRVRTGVRTGIISRLEAAKLRQQIRQLYQLDDQYRTNGFTRQETADLQDEYRDVRQQVRLAEAGSQYDQDDGVGDGRADAPPARRTGLDSLIDKVTGKPPR